jgi:hypothetical protein
MENAEGMGRGRINCKPVSVGEKRALTLREGLSNSFIIGSTKTNKVERICVRAGSYSATLLACDPSLAL